MRKIFTIVFVCILFISTTLSTYADEYTISYINGEDSNFHWETKLSLRYDDTKNLYYLYYSLLDDEYWYEMTPKQLDDLREIVNKAMDWSKTAISNKVEIEKELPDSQLSFPVKWTRDGTECNSNKNVTMKFIFKSIIVYRNARPLVYLDVSSDAVAAKEFDFWHVSFINTSFSEKAIKNFAYAISPETVNNVINNHSKEVEKEKAKSDLFK